MAWHNSLIKFLSSLPRYTPKPWCSWQSNNGSSSKQMLYSGVYNVLLFLWPKVECWVICALVASEHDVRNFRFGNMEWYFFDIDEKYSDHFTGLVYDYFSKWFYNGNGAALLYDDDSTGNPKMHGERKGNRIGNKQRDRERGREIDASYSVYLYINLLLLLNLQ